MTEKATISTEDELIGDGLENLIAQLGTGQDKRNASVFKNNKQLSRDGGQVELSALYRTEWLAGKVVDIVPNDMTREWRTFNGEIEPGTIQILEDEENRLKLVNAFNQAHKWARLYGTAFIIMSIDDGGRPEDPLNINNIKKGGLRHIKVIDRHRIDHKDVQPISDPLSASFGFPELYRFSETSAVIHYTRIIRFDGVKLPFDEFRRNNFYSDSVIDRLYESITNFNTVTDSAASMVYETNVDILKIKGLMNLIQTPAGEDLIRKRFTLAGLLKSFNNMMLLDSEETIETKTNTFAGLPDLIDRYSSILASASDIPATRLLGSSASGLNATGEGDLKNYYDRIRADQIIEYKPELDRFDIIMAKSLGLTDGLDLSYEFDPLFQMTPKDIADTEFVQAQRDASYLDRDIIKPSTVLKDLRQKGTYTNVTDEEVEELEEFENGFDTDNDNTGFIQEEEETSEEENEEGESSEGSENSGSEIS